MRMILKYALLCLTALMMVSCIENDLSYPEAVPEVTAFEVEGQKSVSIDNEARTIAVVMGENADMANAPVKGFEFTHNAEVVGGMPEYLDLRKPVTLTLRVYEDYEWTVTATQPIERYIRCDNQVGEPDIDPEAKIAYVYVNANQDLSKVKFNDIKLEPEGSVVTSTVGYVSAGGQTYEQIEECNFPAEPMVLDCVIIRYFYVRYNGEDIRWSVKVLHKIVDVNIDSVNPWAGFAMVRGVTNGKGTPVFEYRKSSDTEWITYKDVKVDGASVSAEIRGLEPGTEYVLRLNNGEIASPEKTFVTGSAVQLENLSFDNWSKNKGKDYPNAAGSKVWDSANSSGAATTTTATDDAVKGKAARLESVSALGLMAAGNIFTGSFVGLAGLGAELDWGTPFTERPLAMRGYFKYSPKTINKAKDPYKDQMGKTDQCQILVFLTDWDKPFRINTSKGYFVDFDNDPGIIALGQLNTSETVSEYVSFTLPLKYRSGDRIPKYIVVAGASSRYGDYFTGGIGSVLHIDEFELIYDPADLTDEEYAAVFGEIK